MDYPFTGSLHRAKHDASIIEVMSIPILKYSFAKHSEVEMTDHDDINIVSRDMLIDGMNLKDKDTKIYKHMIDSLEKFAIENIKNDKCVSIPYIGCLSYDVVLRKMKKDPSLRAASKVMDRESYKNYVVETYYYLKDKQMKLEKKRLLIDKLKRTNKAKYERLYNKLGRAYAEAYIFAISILEYAPFDQEWQDKYDKLMGIVREEYL